MQNVLVKKLPRYISSLEIRMICEKEVQVQSILYCSVSLFHLLWINGLVLLFSTYLKMLTKIGNKINIYIELQIHQRKSEGKK